MNKKKIKIVRRILVEEFSKIPDENRSDTVATVLTDLFSDLRTGASSDINSIIPYKPNSAGRVVECPYGLFKTPGDCRTYIMNNNYDEFIQQYSDITVPTFTERQAKINGNTIERHTVYCIIVSLCKSRTHMDWFFLTPDAKTRA